ncbi:hypothetical protein BGW41_004328 [Actinomortierella wolfii]|nr:hypothetical protein BGW41_004328 [Actinomortierella wolfii]
MRSRSSWIIAATTALGMLATIPTAMADLRCTQTGSNTFRVGSTLKFQWNDTMTADIESFNLNLYCAENAKLIVPDIVPNLSTLTSPSPVSWVVPSDLTTHSADCQLNQYYAAFVWPTTDPETGATTQGMAKCMTLLFVNPNAPATGGGGAGDNNDEPFESDPGPEDNPKLDENGNIIVSDRVKSIVIGVGCAVGVLFLSGIVGFYVIRYRNKRAVEKEELERSRKLREPMMSQGGAGNHLPLFPPSVHSASSSGRTTPTGTTAAGGNGIGTIAPSTTNTSKLGQNRYNELSSTTSTSAAEDYGDKQSNHRYSQFTDRSDFGTNAQQQIPIALARTATPPPSHTPTSPTSPSMASRPSTPIAAAHAKILRSHAGGDSALSPTMAYSSLSGGVGSGSSDRPVSVLTSSFVPLDDDSQEQQQQRKKQQEYQQYEMQAQLQQQQIQQQQMQQYMNYGSY